MKKRNHNSDTKSKLNSSVDANPSYSAAAPPEPTSKTLTHNHNDPENPPQNVQPQDCSVDTVIASLMGNDKANPALLATASSTDQYRPTVKDQCQTVLALDPLVTTTSEPPAAPVHSPAFAYKDQMQGNAAVLVAPARSVASQHSTSNTATRPNTTRWSAALPVNDTAASPEDGHSTEPILVTARVVNAEVEPPHRSSTTTTTITKRKPIDP
jgi:hypothetical protein